MFCVAVVCAVLRVVEEAEVTAGVPAEPAELASLAGVLASQERFTEAAAHWAQISRMDPTAASAWTNRGVMLIRSALAEQADEAVGCFERAQQLEPHVPSRRAMLDKAVAWRSQTFGNQPVKQQIFFY